MHALFQQTMSRTKFVGRFTPSTERETFADQSSVSFSKHVVKLVLKTKTVDLQDINLTRVVFVSPFFSVLQLLRGDKCYVA